VLRPALAAVMSIALAACAGAPPKADHPAESYSVPAARPPPDPRVVMVDLAISMIGQPYRYGGAAPGGFDCSGLVAYAAGGAGIRMPRTAQEQLASGMPIERGELQAGDLVFMHLAHKELHVGIALDNQRFIHAPSTGGHVRIDSLGAAPYSRGFANARRIMTTP
jgi:cell wall-associated NlpC family hydrolase